MPDEMRPREPVSRPVPSLSTTRNAAATIEASAVRFWPRVSSSPSGATSSPAAASMASVARSASSASSRAGAAGSSSLRVSIDA